MRKTKNEDLLREIVETCDMLDYYSNHAHNLLQQLKNITLTRTEEERWDTKERLIEDLEMRTY